MYQHTHALLPAYLFFPPRCSRTVCRLRNYLRKPQKKSGTAELHTFKYGLSYRHLGTFCQPSFLARPEVFETAGRPLSQSVSGGRGRDVYRRPPPLSNMFLRFLHFFLELVQKPQKTASGAALRPAHAFSLGGTFLNIDHFRPFFKFRRPARAGRKKPIHRPLRTLYDGSRI